MASCAIKIAFVVIVLTVLFVKISHGTETFLSTDEIKDVVNCSKSYCTGPMGVIYCNYELIAASQHFGTENWCPGPVLSFPPEEVLKNFNGLPKELSKAGFLNFCVTNFNNGTLLDEITPEDWKETVPNMQIIKHPDLKNFAQKLHDRWKNLGRKFKPEVKKNQTLYPVYYVDRPFIVPGGKFNVFYYWDTFWIMKGLFFSGMHKTAGDILRNYAQLIDILGYIPHADKISISGQSQPPFFIQMVDDYLKNTQDTTLVKELLVSMDKEFDFWVKNRTSQVKTPDGSFVELFQYQKTIDCPECSHDGYPMSMKAAAESENQDTYVWAGQAGMGESGWHSGTRWFSYTGSNRFSMPSVKTQEIVPVDLNAILCKNAQILSTLHESIGSKDKAKFYGGLHEKLVNAMDEMLWNETAGVWFDYDIKLHQHRDRFYISNVYPLYASCYPKARASSFGNVVTYLESQDVLNFKGGIPTSLHKSEEQWDFPNGWPPTVHLFIESLRLSNNSQLQLIAKETAQKWISTNYNGLFNPKDGAEGGMWEKYDVRYDDGRSGTGGVYPVQQGFGWTNGVVLDLLRTYGSDLAAPESQNSNKHYIIYISLAVVSTVLLIALIIFGIIYWKRRHAYDEYMLVRSA